MINMDEINAEIAALEAGKTTYATCERLSILYNVRNNLMSNQHTTLTVPSRILNLKKSPETQTLSTYYACLTNT